MNTQQEIKDLAYASVQSEYEKIMVLIKEAAIKGQMCIWVKDKNLTTALLDRLSQEGFDTTGYSHRAVLRKISWR